MQLANQPTYKMNLTSISADRECNNPGKNKIGICPERSIVGKMNKALSMGLMLDLKAEINDLSASLPIKNVIEQLITVSGWADRGVQAVGGVFDMSDAIACEIAMSNDGASLLSNVAGYVLETVKPIGDDITCQLSGHGPGCTAPEGFRAQSCRAGLVSGVLMGPDSKDLAFT
jgi:hypothetical protein